MNCKNCNNPLEPQAKFCARCGTTVKASTMGGGTNPTLPATPMGSRPAEADATVIAPQQPAPLVLNPQSLPQQSQQSTWFQPDSYTRPGGPTSYPPSQAPTEALPFQQSSPSKPSAPPLQNAQLQQSTPKPRRSPAGCLLRVALVLVLLTAALLGTWVFALQPYIHAMVLEKLDTNMAKAVDRLPSAPQLPSLPGQLPIPIPIPLPTDTPSLTLSIPEDVAQAFMRANVDPSDPIKDPVVKITEKGVRLEFTASLRLLFVDFNFPSAVSFRPEINAQGELVARDVNIEGIATLVLAPDELTSLLNKHFANAMTKLRNPITNIQFQEGSANVTFKLR